MSWYIEETPGWWECVLWTCYCCVFSLFLAKCGYRGSRWYADESLVNYVEVHNLRVSLKACNWNLGTGA